MFYDFVIDIKKYTAKGDADSLTFYLSTIPKKQFKYRHISVIQLLKELDNNELKVLLNAISSMKVDSFYFPTDVIESLINIQDAEVQLLVINLFSRLQLKFHAEILSKMNPMNEEVHTKLITVYEDLI